MSSRPCGPHLVRSLDPIGLSPPVVEIDGCSLDAIQIKAIDEIDVQIAVAIAVEKSSASAVRLDQEIRP